MRPAGHTLAISVKQYLIVHLDSCKSNVSIFTKNCKNKLLYVCVKASILDHNRNWWNWRFFTSFHLLVAHCNNAFQSFVVLLENLSHFFVFEDDVERNQNSEWENCERIQKSETQRAVKCCRQLCEDNSNWNCNQNPYFNFSYRC